MTSASVTVETSRTTKLGVACALAVFIAALALYAATLAPTVTLVDSGELILAARTLGVAHPPGFPLYVLLAHLATLVPIGSIAVRVNFASALFAALASAIGTLVALEAIAGARLSVSLRKKADRGKKTRKVPESPKATEDNLTLAVPCMVTGLLLAFSRTLWAYATIAEVYTLNTMLLVLIFLLMLRWRRGISDPSLPPFRGLTHLPRHSYLYAAAFVFGLALGVHHVTVGLSLPAFAALVFATEGIEFFTSRRLIYAALFAFAGLFAVYAYLPLAASRSPIMNWGDPRTFERLWWHITGKQYQVFLSFSLKTMASQFGDFIKLAAREFGPWWLPVAAALAVAGLVAAYRRDKAIFWFLALVIAADLAYCLGYEIAEDKDAYYLPTFISMAIAAGLGAQWLLSLAKPGRARDLYQRDLTLNQRINTRFYDMIVAFVNNHIQSAPVYVTLDIAANRDGTDSELTKSLANSYQFVPQGLVFQLIEGRGFRQPSDPQLITRGLADGSMKFEDDDVVKLKVLPVYVTMFYNRGRYLAANGRHEQAIESFKRALDLEPGFKFAQQAINESVSAMNKSLEPR